MDNQTPFSDGYTIFVYTVLVSALTLFFNTIVDIISDTTKQMSSSITLMEELMLEKYVQFTDSTHTNGRTYLIALPNYYSKDELETIRKAMVQSINEIGAEKLVMQIRTKHMFRHLFKNIRIPQNVSVVYSTKPMHFKSNVSHVIIDWVSVVENVTIYENVGNDSTFNQILSF